MQIGIEKIGFYTPEIFIDMKKLALARNVEPEKYTHGIGQEQMAVPPLSQDAVTLAANAAKQILTADDLKTIDLIIFATESSIDESKAGSVYVQSLLNIQSNTRCIELKQACYSATAGLNFAKGHILQNPTSKVLVLASDIAKYGLETSGEPTQGAGAIAMLISNDPKIAEFTNKATFKTIDIMDFWRPTSHEYALVNGKFSAIQYIKLFKELWTTFSSKYDVELNQDSLFCFHLPFTKMGTKALQKILKTTDAKTAEAILNNFETSTILNKKVGNIYTGSLYLSLLSLLINNHNLANQTINMFSYGSGAVAELFAIKVSANYIKHLDHAKINNLLNNRCEISIEQYEKIYNTKIIENTILSTEFDHASFQLLKIEDMQRKYLKID